MLTTNFKILKAKSDCENGYRKLAKTLGGIRSYGKETPITLLQILDSNGLMDAVWCLSCTIENSDHIARMFSVMCAERVLPIFETQYPDDKRPRQCIETVWLYLNGKATEEQLATTGYAVAKDSALAAWVALATSKDSALAAWAARDAARAAAWAAAVDASDAAWAAAVDASDAAMAATWATADAVWATAARSAWAAKYAEKEAQKQILRQLLERELCSDALKEQKRG